jgi:hypothetical protein
MLCFSHNEMYGKRTQFQSGIADLGLLLILALLVFGAIGFIGYRAYRLDHPTASVVHTRSSGLTSPLGSAQTNPALPSLQGLPALQPVATPHPDWLTYTNTKYGYQFKYPNGVKLTTDIGENVIRPARADSGSADAAYPGCSCEPQFAFDVAVAAMERPLTAEGIRAAPSTSVPTVTAGVLAGQVAFKAVYPTNQSVDFYFIQVGDTILGIDVARHDALSGQIFATFSLIR